MTAFVVDDVETACEELRDAGCEVWDVQTEGVASWAYFRAPDGNLYEVFSGSDLEGG